MRQIFRILLLVVFGILVAIVSGEVGLRILYGARAPQYINHVRMYSAHDDIGWVYRPNFEFNWRGTLTGCVEYDAYVKTNKWGFRGNDWTLEKPDDLIRVAMIGDSHISAIEVAEEESSSAVLENMLVDTFPDQSFEVMNFGIRGHSIGQFLLTYDSIVSQFDPDYVVVNVTYFHMIRNSDEFVADEYGSLSVRPRFILDDDLELQLVEPTDLDEFRKRVDSAEELITRVEPDSYTLLLELLLQRKLITFTPPTHQPPYEAPDNYEYPDFDEGYAILQSLVDFVKEDDAELILLDGFNYWTDYEGAFGAHEFVEVNQQFARDNEIGYVDLSSELREASEYVIFPCDRHYTPLGNRILARVIFDWLNDKLKN